MPAARRAPSSLFTDGVANGGIQEPPAVAEAIAGAMRGRRTKVFTFGFGNDAEEEMLKTIAETTQAQYYHVASDERIAHAFGNCIGGLVSVVAQNVTLTLTHGAHATVAKVHGSYPTTVDPATHTTVVELGDLYGEEKKNLLDLTLPPLETPVGSEDVVNASLTYFDARENRSVTRTTTSGSRARPRRRSTRRSTSRSTSRSTACGWRTRCRRRPASATRATSRRGRRWCRTPSPPSS